VQEFWDELSEADLPITQPLKRVHATRQVTSDLGLEAEVTMAAPPKPRFETSREIQQKNTVGNGATRPKIVVAIAGQPAMTSTPTIAPTQGFAAPQQTGRVTVAVARNGQAPRAFEAAKAVKAPRRGRDFVVGLVLVLCFAGLLVATGAYVRSLIKGRPATQTTQPPTDVGREAVAITDVNLRASPTSRSDRVGLAELGSRVKVLSVSNNNNWCEVEIIQHARPKGEPTSADRGWVNRDLLKFD
jgi:hypothetical protein